MFATIAMIFLQVRKRRRKAGGNLQRSLPCPKNVSSLFAGVRDYRAIRRVPCKTEIQTFPPALHSRRDAPRTTCPLRPAMKRVRRHEHLLKRKLGLLKFALLKATAQRRAQTVQGKHAVLVKAEQTKDPGRARASAPEVRVRTMDIAVAANAFLLTNRQ